MVTPASIVRMSQSTYRHRWRVRTSIIASASWQSLQGSINCLPGIFTVQVQLLHLKDGNLLAKAGTFLVKNGRWRLTGDPLR